MASQNIGPELERKVELWARKAFNASASGRNKDVHGLTVKNPYEADVWIHIPRGFFKDDIDMWIECTGKDPSIKRNQILEFVGKARDVYKACRRGKEDIFFNRLMFVSTAGFHSDAIALADQEGVACVLYDGAYRMQNGWKLDREPQWLRDVEAAWDRG